MVIVSERTKMIISARNTNGYIIHVHSYVCIYISIYEMNICVCVYSTYMLYIMHKYIYKGFDFNYCITSMS